VSFCKDNKRILVALDYSEERQALDMIAMLDPDLCRVKIGKELFTRCGPLFVKRVVNEGFDVFLDLKFHDIPNTTANACLAAADLGIWMMNVHALGGRNMMTTAKEALLKHGYDDTLLIGVTILTSMGPEDLCAIGLHNDPAENVIRLAKLASESGLDGVVCSAQEVSMIRADLGDEFILVTPGVRPLGASLDDQKRIMTPSKALESGSDFLVIGRPITKAKEPAKSLQQIYGEINAVLN